MDRTLYEYGLVIDDGGVEPFILTWEYDNESALEALTWSYTHSGHLEKNHLVRRVGSDEPWKRIDDVAQEGKPTSITNLAVDEEIRWVQQLLCNIGAIFRNR